jgi:hypothetical protein
LSLTTGATPDLDLIKQAEQEPRTGVGWLASDATGGDTPEPLRGHAQYGYSTATLVLL